MKWAANALAPSGVCFWAAAGTPLGKSGPIALVVDVVGGGVGDVVMGAVAVVVAGGVVAVGPGSLPPPVHALSSSADASTAADATLVGRRGLMTVP